MTVSERAAGGITVLDLNGRLILGASAEGLRDKVRSLLQLTRQGGTLRLLNTTGRLHDLLVITKLATVFDCYDSEDAALASFVVPA